MLLDESEIKLTVKEIKLIRDALQMSYDNWNYQYGNRSEQQIYRHEATQNIPQLIGVLDKFKLKYLQVITWPQGFGPDTSPIASLQELFKVSEDKRKEVAEIWLNKMRETSNQVNKEMP